MAWRKEPKEKGKGYPGSTAEANHARLLYESLEQYNREQKKRKRPSIILACLLCLFLSSGGGLALAILLLLQPVDIQVTCLSRDLILFAASMSLLYIVLHVRGARRDYRTAGPGPPQIYGNYLHASALLLARISIAVWLAALIATAIMISKAVPFEGWVGKLPFLDMVICLGAIPPFIIILTTVEKHPTPFATAAISRNSFLTCRVSEFADDLVADMSVSRRASLQRKESQRSGSVLTMPTEDIFHIGVPTQEDVTGKKAKNLSVQVKEIRDDSTELMANSPIRSSHATLPHSMRPSSIPPVPPLPEALSKSPPEPIYNPGGWRHEWDNANESIGPPDIPSTHSSTTGPPSTQWSSGYSSSSGASQKPLIASSKRKHKHGAASTSIASSSQRSGLATVRYASDPEVAVRQPMRVVPNPAFAGYPGAWPEHLETVQKPLRVKKRSQPGQAQKLRRKPSNFSRKIPVSRGSGAADSAVDMKVPGAFEA
ncbi:hypothetical protein F5Y15DRAFT_313115 [Xylariaceae sp. FL0016]|nr:hypothetical protein F5Y15DRAFT_313115 [Xylariaceae sp. FL0016]